MAKIWPNLYFHHKSKNGLKQTNKVKIIPDIIQTSVCISIHKSKWADNQQISSKLQGVHNWESKQKKKKKVRMQRTPAIHKHTCINTQTHMHKHTVSAHSRQDVGHVWPKAALEGLMHSFVLGTDSLVMFHPPFPWDRLTKHWDSKRQDRQRGSVPWRLSAARKIPDPLWALYPCRACISVHTSWATINLAEAAWQWLCWNSQYTWRLQIVVVRY